MKQKTKIALYLFLFLFPIIHIVVFLLYYVLVFVDGYKQEQIITSKIQCVTKYSKYIDGKIRNVYVMENVLSQRFLDDYPPFFLSNKSVFLEYNADSKQSDTTVTVSFNKDNKENTVLPFYFNTYD